MIMGKGKIILLILTIIAASLIGANSEAKFEKRYAFSLGNNVIVARFSSDYTVLAVIQSGKPFIYSYNPMTFQLIGSHPVQDGAIPVDLQIYGNYILVAAQPGLLMLYSRKVGDGRLELKYKYNLKLKGQLVGLKLQKVNEDFTDKSAPQKTRHVVVWSNKNFQVLKYTPTQSSNPFANFTEKSYENTTSTLTTFQFVNEKFLVFGLKTGPNTGETRSLELSKPQNITTVDSNVALSMLSFYVRSTTYPFDHYFLGVGQDSQVSQFNNKVKKGSDPIINLTKAWGSFDNNNQMLGFYNQSSIYISTVSQLSGIGYPNYKPKLSQNKKAEQPPITIVAMPQNTTGEFITNNCQQNNQKCFYYYSQCPAGSYLTKNATGAEICKSCNVTNCFKCLNGDCVMCANGFWIDNTKKCQLCASQIYGCNSCTQNGKNCHSCDTKQYMPTPINNVCQCIKGNVYDTTGKKCVSCPTKIPFCSTCTLQGTTITCSECQNNLNRILSDDFTSCICNPDFYYENSTRQCQLCDPFKKCLHCSNTGQCSQCDASKMRTLNQKFECVCMPTFVDVNNQCDLCFQYIKDCKTCSNTQKCDTCDTSLHRNSTPTQDGKCICENLYTQNSDQVCVLCDVIGCSNCQIQNYCNTCDTIQNRVQTPVNGTCLCQPNYTENSQKQCVLCTTPGCLNCQTQNMCTTCDTTKGFNQTITDGKCQCIATKYLDSQSNTCQDCSKSLFGCQLCSNGTACETCNSSLNFNPVPVNGSCKCLSNYFVSGSQCVQCQVICQHCQKCVQVATQEFLTITVGCAQCEDDFEVKDLKCVQKPSNSWVFILIGIGLLTLLIIVGVCYLKRKRARKQQEDRRKSKDSQASMVSMLLKQNDPQFLTSDRTQVGTKKTYEPLFSGNINYSISSDERQTDKKTFNETLKQLEKQRKQEFDRKNKTSNYKDLSNNMSINKKPSLTEQQIMDKKKQSLFSHRGKG